MICEVPSKRDLSSCPIFLSSPSPSFLPSPLPSSSCPAHEKTAATKNQLQAKLPPPTLPWMRATGEVFVSPCLEAGCTHQTEALGAHEASACVEGRRHKVERHGVVQWLRAKPMESDRLGF